MRRPNGPDDHRTSQCYRKWPDPTYPLDLGGAVLLATMVHHVCTASFTAAVVEEFGRWGVVKATMSQREIAETRRRNPDVAQMLADGWCVGLHVDAVTVWRLPR